MTTVMTQVVQRNQTRGLASALTLVTALLASCGDGSVGAQQSDESSLQEASGIENGNQRANAQATESSPPAVSPVDAAPSVTLETEISTEIPTERATTEPEEPTPIGCRPGLGVSGAPGSIGELVELINSLPKPTNLACFMESLERPLDVFLTRSGQSGQPAVGAANPRVFVFYNRLSFTIVPGGGGESSEVLEFAERTTDEDVDRQLAATRDVTLQAVHGEIGFPVYGKISNFYLEDRISSGVGRTLCGGCHLGERLTAPEEGYFEGAIASNIMAPFQPYDVDLGQFRNELVTCDPEEEPERCEVLSAIFDFGEVRPFDFR